MNSKGQLTSALRAFLNQPPRLFSRKYASIAEFRAARKVVARDRSDALRMLERVEKTEGISREGILHAWRGVPRLTLATGDRISIGYHPQKSWAMEYRSAVAVICALALHDFWLTQMPKGELIGELYLYHGLTAGEWLRRRAARELGDGTAARWF